MFMLEVTDSAVSPTQIALKVLPLSSSKLPHEASGPSSWKFRSSERRRGEEFRQNSPYRFFAMGLLYLLRFRGPKRQKP
jgi:hypothetical protein